MPGRHLRGLKKRYNEVDYVSEYRNHWAVFNAWFYKETGATNDRNSIEALKRHPQVVNSIRTLALVKRDRFLRSTHRWSQDYVRYRTRTVISDFFQACFTSRRYLNELNLFGQKAGSRVRPTYSIYLPLGKYRNLHTHRAHMLGNLIHIPEIDMNELFIDRGIAWYGSVLSRGRVRRISRNKRQGSTHFWNNISADSRLISIYDLSRQRTYDRISSDVIEMLYLTRNLSVHGVFDHTIGQHNAIARTAHQVLDSIVRKLTN